MSWTEARASDGLALRFGVNAGQCSFIELEVEIGMSWFTRFVSLGIVHQARESNGDFVVERRAGSIIGRVWHSPNLTRTFIAV
jgi:hypothetical protein